MSTPLVLLHGWGSNRDIWRPLLAGLAGAVAFPLNYWAGQRLGAVEFGYPLLVTLAVLALVWGAVLPLMVRLTTRAGRAQRAGGPA